MDRTKPTDLRWLLALCAAAGTFLLVFIPGDRWLNGATEAGEMLTAVLLKQLLTVSLLMIVPALWARLAHRVSPWTLVFLTGLAYGSGLWLAGGALDALYAALLIILPGAGLYCLQRLKISNFRTVLYTTFLTLLGLFCCTCLNDLIREGDAYRSAKWILGLYEESLSGYEMDFAALGLTEFLTYAKETVQTLRLSAETVAVPMLLTAAMVAGLSNTLFSHLMNRRGGADLTSLPPFREWRCERWYVILVAVFSLTTFALRMFGTDHADALSSVADVLWRMPCALAGLCAVRRVGVKARKGWIFWIAFAALLTLPPIALMLLTILGMLASLKSSKNKGEDGLRQ